MWMLKPILPTSYRIIEIEVAIARRLKIDPVGMRRALVVISYASSGSPSPPSGQWSHRAPRQLQLLRRVALVGGRASTIGCWRRGGVGFLRGPLHRRAQQRRNCVRDSESYFRARDEFEPGSRDQLLHRLRCGACDRPSTSARSSRIRVNGVSRVSAARTYRLQPAPSWLLLSWPSWPRLPLQSTYSRHNICRCYARTALVPGRSALPRPARHC